MLKYTKAHDDALNWLRERGGDGSRQGPGRQLVLAAGDIAPCRWSTWKALAAHGLVTINKLRVTLTADGATRV